MIERNGPIPVKRQGQLLDLSRSSVYYVASCLQQRDLKLMRRMGMEAIYRKPHTSIRAQLSATYPYLLTGLKIELPNHDFEVRANGARFPVSDGHHRRG
jgi:hypothetical protein